MKIVMVDSELGKVLLKQDGKYYVRTYEELELEQRKEESPNEDTIHRNRGSHSDSRA